MRSETKQMRTLSGVIHKPETPVTDYANMVGKPEINGVKLAGNKSFADLGARPITNYEILDIFNKVFDGEENENG